MLSIDLDTLEGMEWSFDRGFRALGYRFRVRSDLSGIGEVLERLLGPFAESRSHPTDAIYTLTHRLTPSVAEPEGGFRYELFIDDGSIQRVNTPGPMLEWLILDFTRRAVAGTDRFLAVHSGVAALEGRAILLVAPPDSGKTTLVAGLTRAGFQFLGDEVALLDATTTSVHPFLRPLLIEPSSMPILDGLASELPEGYGRFRGSRYSVAPDDLREGAVGEASRVAFVVLPSYRAGSETRLTPVSRAEALTRMARQTFNLSAFGSRGIEILADVIAGAGCYELPIGDLAAAIERVWGLFDGGPPRSSPAIRSRPADPRGRC